MNVSDLVERGVKAHLGRSYAEAQSYFLVALLVSMGVPAERFDTLGEHDLTAPSETSKPVDAVYPRGKPAEVLAP